MIKSPMTAFLIFLALLIGITDASAKTLIIEADLPDQYVGIDTNGSGYEHAAIVIDQETGLIEAIASGRKEISLLKDRKDATYLQLRQGSDWDVVYPGLIDLHNHTKQNNLGVWEEAHGQFANRFEWRAWSNYTYSVSGNMNPWIGYGKAISCAAFRWSEIQAMVVGTTYLQGPSSCVEDFAIHQVESESAFPHSKKDRVQAPTDLVIPADMVFVWNTLKPIMDRDGKNYEEALADVINEYCDSTVLGIKFNATEVMSEKGLEILKDKAILEAACTKKVPLDQLPKKFIRYIYWVHKSIAGKKKYAEEITSGNGSAIIAHLAEGRRNDKYNQTEYEVVKLLGMNKKGVNFVHAVGVDESGLEDMAKNQMGIIWSPFSNLLLYNETLDIKSVLEKDILVALGSDWLPTGSKGPLEEMKVAYDYIVDQGLTKSIVKMQGATSVHHALFKMVTENPAKMINHWQGTHGDPWENGEAQGGVGVIAPKAMASLIVTSKKDKMDPYKNIVEDIWENDINLVIVDGLIRYGNQTYVKAAGHAFEVIGSNNEFDMENLSADSSVPVLFNRNQNPTADEEFDFLTELSEYILTKAEGGKIDATLHCQFSDEKVMVHQETMADNKELDDFRKESGLNLDRFQDLQRLLGVNLITQSRNRNDPEKGNKDFVVKDFTPLYTCNDEYHSDRVKNFIKKTWPEDRRNRPEVFSSKPERMAEDYQ